MGQDIREMFRNQEPDTRDQLRAGHTKRFEQKLKRDLPKTSTSGNRFFFLKIAAILIVALGVGFFFLNNQAEVAPPEIQVTETPVEANNFKEETVAATNYRLSNVSPEFKKVEDYYLASLNIQLAGLELTPKNKELVDVFMLKLETLDKEYIALNAEIEQNGLNDETLTAMISNLQIRLDLLKKLKSKLNELKQSNNNSHENYQA
ncbi:hypothetical protein [Gramella sp. AN32]|uniref:Anti-sigma factor n=1 Tax=Christiangramia antarctica TaxID=2058158 RepID=A0ABW5X5V7_9FLAO|nr:hypothetical protein [Gramella sp. AN32]MCM4158081.1 hypothetical protein [Gramella sp. AN32]